MKYYQLRPGPFWNLPVQALAERGCLFVYRDQSLLHICSGCGAVWCVWPHNYGSQALPVEPVR